MRGNTVNLTDPSGEFVFLAALAAIAIVGAVGTILGGIGGFAVDIYNQLNNNGGNWNCLDVGQAAQRGLNNALFGAGVGLTVGVAGVGAYSLLSPWLIPAAGTLGAQDPKKVETAIEVGHDVVDWVGETLAAQDSSVSHTLIDSSPNGIQDALPNLGAVQAWQNINPYELGLTGTVQRHAEAYLSPKSGVPEFVERPYGDLRVLMGEIMQAAEPIPDPRGTENGWLWRVPGTLQRSYFPEEKDPSVGYWELVIDVKNKIVLHFMWNGK